MDWLFCGGFVGDVMCSSVWLEVGLSHPKKVLEFIDSADDCRLKLVSVLNDFTNRLSIVSYYLCNID